MQLNQTSWKSINKRKYDPDFPQFPSPSVQDGREISPSALLFSAIVFLQAEPAQQHDKGRTSPLLELKLHLVSIYDTIISELLLKIEDHLQVEE